MHSFILELMLYPYQGHCGSGAYPRNAGTHPGWDAGPVHLQGTSVIHTHTLTPRAKLVYPIHLHACFWEVGGNPHRHDMGRKHSELYRDINPGSGSNHGTWSYETWRQPAVLPVEKQLTPISSFPNFLSSMNINNSPPQPTEEDGEGWRSRFLNLPCVWVVKIFN